MRYLRPILTWLIVLVVAYLAFRFLKPLFAAKKEEMDVQTIAVQRDDLRLVVPADGQVQPQTLVEVKSKASEVVEKVLVEPGDVVTAGQVLVELGKTQITSRLKQAEADLSAAQARLKKIKASLTPREKSARESSVRQAQIAYDEAKEHYDRIAELFAKGYATQEEMDAAQAQLNQAQESLDQAQTQMEMDLQGGEPEDIAVAEAEVLRVQAQVDDMKEELGNTTIRAPIAGTVLSRDVEVGTAVASGVSGNTGGTVVATIGDLSTMYIKAEIDETDLGRVHVGLPCRISFDAYTNWIWRGKVSKIYPQGEEQQSNGMGGGGGARFRIDVSIDLASAYLEQEHSFAGKGGRSGGRNVRIFRMGAAGVGGMLGIGTALAAEPAQAPPPGGAPPGEKPKHDTTASAEGHENNKPAHPPQLYPQMTANVEIVLEDHPDVLILPAQYIKYDDGKPYCEVLPDPKNQQVKERRELTLGFSDGLRYEVQEGLKEGETVILERPIKKQD